MSVVVVGGILAAILITRAGASSTQRDGCSLRTADGEVVPLGRCDVITPHVQRPRQLQQPAGVVTVPSVIGLPIGEATTELNQYGLRVRSTGAGQVLTQIPGAGAVVARSEIVELTASA